MPRTYTEGTALPFGGVVLRQGAESEDVRLLQEYLSYVARTYTAIPSVSVTGYFGPRTREAVIAFQEAFSLPVSGTVGAITWHAITDVYSDLYKGAERGEGQAPGTVLG